MWEGRWGAGRGYVKRGVREKKKKHGRTEGKCQQDKHTSSLSSRTMVKRELAMRVRSASSWVVKSVSMCWCFVPKAQCEIVYPNHCYVICHVTFSPGKLARYYCIVAMRYWICNGTGGDFPLEVRLIYAFLFKDVIVEADWYTPTLPSDFCKINIKISLMSRSTIILAQSWVTTSCLVIWTLKGGETPTKMVAVLLFVE